MYDVHMYVCTYIVPVVLTYFYVVCRIGRMKYFVLGTIFHIPPLKRLSAPHHSPVPSLELPVPSAQNSKLQFQSVKKPRLKKTPAKSKSHYFF